MKYVQDIIFVYKALLSEYDALLGTSLGSTLLNPIDLNFDQNKLIRVLTVDHPRYDSYLLSYLEGDLSVSEANARIDIEPFSTLFQLLVEGSTDPGITVEAYRQLAVFGKKLQAPCGKDKDLFMMDRMFFTDKSLPLKLPITPIIRLARMLIADVLGVTPPLGLLSDCSHGSGASANKVDVPLRWELQNLRFTPNLFYLSDFTDLNVEAMMVTQFEGRTLLVNKDARGPRIICCEESILMAHQQSARKWLHKVFNHNPLTRGRVNLLDQKINQMLAYRGSLTRDVATLDMAEASDRVSLALVKAVFSYLWYQYLSALRSKAYNTTVGKHRHVTMRKYAPMGSALCFPIETVIFWAISSAAIARSRGISVFKAAELCVVHGDDTIVPTDCADAVIIALESCGLKVNTDKSFSKGFFRESCGGDFFRGHDVTPVRHNKLWTNAGERVQQLIVLRNGFYSKGLWRTANELESMYPEVFTTLVTAPVANTHVTFCPNFVGGVVVGQSSYHHATFSCLVNRPAKFDVRPSVMGRYIQYWAERPNAPHISFTGKWKYPIDMVEWKGAYEQVISQKKGKISIKKESIYTQRGERLRRSRVETDIQGTLVHYLKNAGYFAKRKTESQPERPVISNI